MSALENKNILLIVSGGIAAYKSLDLVRLIRKQGGVVRCILTSGGARFITPLSLSALSAQPVYTDLWSLKDETEMGHIRLSREADLVVIAPASASLMAKMACGLADDLASTALLATDKPVMFAPAMNPMMWANPATQDNLRILQKRGLIQIGPGTGDMACGETGEGRMAEPEDICDSIIRFFENRGRLTGLKALVTSGPTFEPIDPVRFIGNRSSGKQGHAIAVALRDFGAAVTLVTGPVALPDPAGIKTIHVETAAAMMAACTSAMPADIAVCAAAVSDWSAAHISRTKIKKSADRKPPVLALQENPDVLATLSKKGKNRPLLVIGFAAETGNLLAAAAEKRERKGCNWIVANHVDDEQKVFGADQNHVFLITAEGSEEWPPAPKTEIARKLAQHIAEHMSHVQKRTRNNNRRTAA